uniref:Uncharacterized protein n=1 Tax=Magallana gigas TaxID=29159 RepID=A0A8W8MAJ8_MAGGI
MSAAISLSIPHCPCGTTAANYTPLLKPQVLEEKFSPTPTKVGRVRISEPSSHDDYISRLDSRICIRDSVG